MNGVSRFAVSVFAAAAFVLLPGGAAASPPNGGPFHFEFTDTGLCTFPLGVSVSGRGQDHLKLHQGSELFTGNTKYVLKNLVTGLTAKLGSPGSLDLDFAAGTASIRGASLAGAIPVASFTGTIQFRLDDGVVLKRTGTKGLVDPCRLVDPSLGPVVPRTTPAPWPAPQDVLGGIRLAGLTPLVYGLAVHTHTHLDVIVNGSAVTVPAGLGIAEPFDTGFGLESVIGALSPLHTHFDDGILHVEADTGPFALTLGQVFDEWQVRLTSSCLGSYCTGGGSSLRVYVNGTQATGDPNAIPLSSCSEIAVVYGPPGVPASPPASYAWAPGVYGC